MIRILPWIGSHALLRRVPYWLSIRTGMMTDKERQIIASAQSSKPPQRVMDGWGS